MITLSSPLVLLLLLTVLGGEFTYVVQRGDSLTSIGARFGVEVRVIAEANHLKVDSRLEIGQSLRIDNRHVAPESNGADIVINVPQRMLSYFREGMVVRQYPIAAGKPTWQTALGAFSVVTMETDPVWDVPASIQEEMRKQGKRVVTRVPPSPENPLGAFWIGLSIPGLGIHGTNQPTSIYKLQTHGCVRLYPDDIRDLFSKVHVGAIGRIIYEPVLLTKAGGGVFLEVHRDPYRKAADPLHRVREMAQAAGLSDVVDWRLVQEVVRKSEGIARNVTFR